MSTFSDKLRRLMRSNGETTRSLGAAVEASSAAVTGWTNGVTPRPDAVKRLAAHFRVPVEVLLDDALESPQSPQEYLNEAPIKTAGRLAEGKPGHQSERQKAFEEYLIFLHSIRAEAEAAAPTDPAEARRIFDHSLATWLATKESRDGEKNLGEIVTRGRAAKIERRQA